MKDLQTLEETSLQENSPSTSPCTASALHMQSAQTAYTPVEVMEILGCGQRTVFKYATEIIQVWHWLPESAFRRDGKYTAFAVDEMRKRKACSLRTYQEETWSREGREAKSVEAESEAETTPTAALTVYEPTASRSHLAVQTVDYSGNLAQKRSLLEEIQRQEEELMAQLSQVGQNLSQNTQQFSEAMTLEDELLLRKARVDGVKLGARYIQEKQTAFQATINSQTGKFVSQ